MKTEIAHQRDVTVVALRGSLDAHSGPAFLEVTLAQVRAGRVRLVADLSQVDHASSAGLQSLLAMLKEARRGGGDLRLAAAGAAVGRALRLAGFPSILRVFAAVEPAVASWTGVGP
jgi:anti-sigma B factor antagonist